LEQVTVVTAAGGHRGLGAEPQLCDDFLSFFQKIKHFQVNFNLNFFENVVLN